MITTPDASIALEEDRLIDKYIDKKYWAIEASLYKSKWFDYRFLSPVKATRLYARVYQAEYKNMYRRYFDSHAAAYVKAIKYPDIFDYAREKKANKSVLTGLWRGRQFADALGMPYQTFIENAFDLTLRHWPHSFKPLPTNLYAEFVIEKMVDLWAEIQLTDDFVAEDERYTNAWYIGTREQNDHHEWLFARADRMGNKVERLADFVSRDLLPVEKVLSRLSAEEADEFQQIVRANRSF